MPRSAREGSSSSNTIFLGLALSAPGCGQHRERERWFQGSFKLGVMIPLPRFGPRTLLQFRLTGGPGPDGRNCRPPREPWVLGGPRVGIDLGKEPVGRPGAAGRALRRASWPARGGGGLQDACEHRRTRLKDGPGDSQLSGHQRVPQPGRICIDARDWSSEHHGCVSGKGAMQMRTPSRIPGLAHRVNPAAPGSPAEPHGAHQHRP